MTNKSPELASVILPTYNRADYIKISLDSIYFQTYRPIEIVVVDDGSTDHTEEVVKSWAQDHEDELFKVRYYKQKNAGAPTARNLGIEKSTGRYLQFMDSDDYLMAEKLELQIQKMKEDNTALCICGYYHVNEDMSVRLVVSNDRTMEEILSDRFSLSTLIGVIEKDFLISKNIRWNPKLKKFQDRDFYHKVFLLIDDFSVVDEPLFKWIRHSGDRIFDSTPNSEGLYMASFKSLFGFYLKRRKEIEKYKRKHIKRIFKILFFYTKTGKSILKILRITPSSPKPQK